MNYSVAQRNTQLDAVRTSYNTGYIRVYNGTKPATADAALAGNTLLAELRFGATAFPAAASGALTANAITADTAADAAGTPTFCRLLASDGTTVLCDITAGVGSGEANFNSAFALGNNVSISSLVLSIPA